MPSRSRPGALQPYDLRLFVPDPSGLHASPSRSNKRAHSPSVGHFDSPAKRRVKAEEGIGSPRLPKSPLSGSSSSARFAPAHFHALLQGPGSPVKRLDFASSEASELTACEASLSEADGSGTPWRSPKRTTTVRVRRSPRLSARISRSSSGNAGPLTSGQPGAETHAAAIRASTSALLKIPRTVTPPDRQSIHYPGFDIYQDPYTVVPNSHYIPSSSADSDLSLSDEEDNKENVAPRRKSSKKASTPVTPSDTVWLKAGLLSPSSVNNSKKPVPRSPHPKHVHDCLALTPKDRLVRPAVSPAATLIAITPGRTPLGKNARRQMRRAMEEEVDDIVGEDE